ncbi:hypothetical protein [Streptomyces niger]|uniref:hypothetical protein n=1 Tax=Streptomyces niger TaxID=66373 RepID=UPI00069A2029|nr:hypothetical protein [Streptomyces niger]
MNTATVTATANRRFRGRRIAAAVAVAAALGLGVTACGQGTEAGAAGSSSSSAQPSNGSSSGGSSSNGSSSNGSSANGSGAQGQNAGKSGGSADSSGSAAGTDSKSAPNGSGVANAGNHKIVEGKLEYMAPGKLIVKPDDGSMDQAFFVANATKVLGAASICSDDPDDGVSLGDDGYGTAECTVEQLEKAAKTKAVTVRVTMSTKSGAAETVEEKYHP